MLLEQNGRCVRGGSGGRDLYWNSLADAIREYRFERGGGRGTYVGMTYLILVRVRGYLA